MYIHIYIYAHVYTHMQSLPQGFMYIPNGATLTPWASCVGFSARDGATGTNTGIC